MIAHVTGMKTVVDVFKDIDTYPNFRERGDFPDIKEDLFWHVYEKYKPYTLTGVLRMYDCFNSIRHIKRAGIEGDIIECGVFMGGLMAAMIEFAKHFGLENRKFWLSDTFEGFPAGAKDVDLHGEAVAFAPYDSVIDTVKHVISLGPASPGEIVFLQGPVENTLATAPIEKLALARLDTDYYESTKCELDELYPRLSRGGVLIIDDYGHFEGVRRAVDEHFGKPQNVCLLNRIDYTCRSGIKIS